MILARKQPDLSKFLNIFQHTVTKDAALELIGSQHSATFAIPAKLDQHFVCSASLEPRDEDFELKFECSKQGNQRNVCIMSHFRYGNNGNMLWLNNLRGSQAAGYSCPSGKISLSVFSNIAKSLGAQGITGIDDSRYLLFREAPANERLNPMVRSVIIDAISSNHVPASYYHQFGLDDQEAIEDAAQWFEKLTLKELLDQISSLPSFPTSGLQFLEDVENPDISLKWYLADMYRNGNAGDEVQQQRLAQIILEIFTTVEDDEMSSIPSSQSSIVSKLRELDQKRLIGKSL